jgi:hypothetical protein
MAPTKMRSLRVEDEVWDAAQERAEREHRSLSDVVRVSLRAYAEGRYDAKEPPRRKK